MRSLLLCTEALAAAIAPLAAQATFTQVLTTQSPPPAGGTVGASNGVGMLVFGSLVATAGSIFTYSDRLWSLDGQAWTDISPSSTLPPARHFYAAAWDANRQRYVLFSLNASRTAPDLDDTWTYQTTNVATSVPIGAGCPGSAGVPLLADNNPPWAGDVYQLAGTTLAPAGVVFAAIGFSTTMSSLGTLPLPLAALTPAAGAGCNLLVSPDAFFFVVNTAGRANLAIPLPNSAAFAGQQIAAQLAQLEVTTTARTSVSNAYVATIGVR
jgi:hypothetical protein